jgi:hypothetical protein
MSERFAATFRFLQRLLAFRGRATISVARSATGDDLGIY